MVKIIVLLVSLGVLVLLIKNSLTHKAVKEKASQKAIDTTNMVKDPVCGTYIEEGGKHRLKYFDKIYHFCSEECMEEFRQEKLKDK